MSAWHWICSDALRLPPITKELKMSDQTQRLKDDPKDQQKNKADDQDDRQNPAQPDVDEDDSGPGE